jgi:uncharacterized protein (DUF885 family)
VSDAPATQAGPVFSLADELARAFAEAVPIQATMVGLPGHDHRWGDLGPEGAARTAVLLRDYRARLRALPPAADRWERLAARVMDGFIEERLADHERGEHRLDLNNIDSTFQHLRMVFDVMDTSSAAGWEAVAERLDGIDGACEGYRARLDDGRRRGEVVAKRQVHAAIEQARVHAGDGSFFRTLPAAYAGWGRGDARSAARLEAGALGARRAFAALADWLEATYLPAARDADPVGRERYVHSASRFLGASIDPIETYAWGWSEVRALEAEMARIAREIVPGASVREVVALLETDPTRGAKSPEEFLDRMRERQEAALTELEGPHFEIPAPLRRIDVRMAPPGGALGAYYVPPTEDFSRPGTVWYAPGEAKTFPLWDEVTTAYHEGFPGHHLQCGLQVHLAGRLSRLHRLFVMYSGYAEGWALYAEQLMGELGYLERPDYVLGMLAAKLMRACRVVVDIGLHLELPIPAGEPHAGETWGWEAAVETMHGRAFLDLDHARSEVVRYLGWPGQAISYKVGERVILELRQDARRRAGPSFDPKAFHARVLGTGSVGLDLLRELVLDDAAG